MTGLLVLLCVPLHAGTVGICQLYPVGVFLVLMWCWDQAQGFVCLRQALFQLSYISRPQVVLLFEVFFSFHVYACMWLCALECRCLGGRSRGQIPGSCSRWVLGREFKFSGRAASALTATASLQPCQWLIIREWIHLHLYYLRSAYFLVQQQEKVCAESSTLPEGALGGQEDRLWPQAPLS